MKVSFNNKTKVFSSILIISLISLIITFQIKHDRLAPPFTTKLAAITRNLFPAKILPYINFGFKNIMTDYYWIRSVQDFTVWNGREPFYLNYFRNISTLDPRFEYPYLFAILIVPQRKEVSVLNEVSVIAKRGLDSIPTSWKIPFYLGTQYYLFTREYNPAEKYLEMATKIKGAPDGVYLVYSTFVGKGLLTREQKANLAKKLIRVIYDNTDNETIKKIAEKGFKYESIIQMLEKGIIAYETRYKKYPNNVEEMEALHLILLPEEIKNDFTFEINKRDGSFKIIEKNNS